MNWEEYEMMAHLQSQIPPKQETPKGQKFHIGEIVKCKNPKLPIKDKNLLYQIEYSYFQKYGGDQEQQTKDYSLKHLFEKNSSAWHHESNLELVKSIDEINEERDLAEYKRLKAKYEPK